MDTTPGESPPAAAATARRPLLQRTMSLSEPSSEARKEISHFKKLWVVFYAERSEERDMSSGIVGVFENEEAAAEGARKSAEHFQINKKYRDTVKGHSKTYIKKARPDEFKVSDQLDTPRKSISVSFCSYNYSSSSNFEVKMLQKEMGETGTQGVGKYEILF